MRRFVGSTSPSLLDGLVRAVTTAYNIHRSDEVRAAAVAEAVRPFLGDPRLLTAEQQRPDPERYRQHVLHVDSRGAFSIVALVWLPGQGTPIHDHVSWCVIGVHEGCEREVSYQLVEEPAASYLVPAGQTLSLPGEVAALTPPGDIHRVENPGPGTAISLHVYGADVSRTGTSIRRRYELPVRPSVGGAWLLPAA